MTDITPIKLAVADDISSGSLVKNLTENDNGSQSGKIKIGYKSYTVSVSDTGEVNVNRKLGFFGRIFIRNSHTATAVRLEKKIADLLKTNEYALIKNSNTQLKNIISNSGGKKDIEVASYGMKNNRIMLMSSGINVDAANKNRNVDSISFNTIDTYNGMIGINTETLRPRNYEATMKAIASGNMKIHDSEYDRLSADCLSSGSHHRWPQNHPYYRRQPTVPQSPESFVPEDCPDTAGEKPHGYKRG